MGGRNEQAVNRQSRQAGAVVTKRHIQASNPQSRNEAPPDTAADNECDTNADTCCLGKNFVILHHSYCTADAYAYDSSIKPVENVPIVTGATAYDDAKSGDTFILVFHESLFYGTKLDHSLLNPDQVRSYGIPFWDNPFDMDRSLSINVDNDLSIPMRSVGTKVLFRSRVPTSHELENCVHITMTSPNIWNPSEVVFAQQTDRGGESGPWKRKISCVCGVTRSEDMDITDDDALLNEIDPSIARLGERLLKRHRVSQIEAEVYDDAEVPPR